MIKYKISALSIVALMLFVVAASGCTSPATQGASPTPTGSNVTPVPDVSLPKTMLDMENMSYLYSLHYFRTNATQVVGPADYVIGGSTYSNDIVNYNGVTANHLVIGMDVTGGSGKSYEDAMSTIHDASVDVYVTMKDGVITNILGGHARAMGRDIDLTAPSEESGFRGISFSDMLNLEGVNGIGGMGASAAEMTDSGMDLAEARGQFPISNTGRETIAIGNKQYDCYVFRGAPQPESGEYTYWWSPEFPGFALKTMGVEYDEDLGCNVTTITVVEEWR